MTIPSELRPSFAPRVMDLVAAAGVDTTDWGNYKRGVKYAGSNPKYCYEWAFVEPDQVVVLNLWYDDLQEKGGRVFQKLNYRQHAAALPNVQARATWVKRSLAMDTAFATAAAQRLPVRVIICAGKKRNVLVDPTQASKVSLRLLDNVPWAVTEYDPATGACVITRGTEPVEFVDQFSLTINSVELPKQREVTAMVIVRDPKVRARVLMRARGYCEYCNRMGFYMASGAIFLETHHVVPLSENGQDSEDNVIALCPNHHRQGHFGKDSERLHLRFLDIVKAKQIMIRSQSRPGS